MGRNTKKQLSEIESLQREIEDLKDINRQLHQKLKKLARKTSEEDNKPVKEEPKPVVSGNICTKCQVGTVTTTDIGVKWLDMCDNVTCKARKTRKKD